MLTGSGQRSPPCKAVSKPRSTAKVKPLMTANPSRLGGTIAARPNGSLPTMAAMAAVNRSPRASLCSARAGSARDMDASLASPGDREPGYGGQPREQTPASRHASDPVTARSAAEAKFTRALAMHRNTTSPLSGRLCRVANGAGSP